MTANRPNMIQGRHFTAIPGFGTTVQGEFAEHHRSGESGAESAAAEWRPMHEAESSIPWSDVIRFHMDIVGRGEESFFSFSPDHEASERWARTDESMMADLAGPWSCKFGEGPRSPFWIGVECGAHESVFLGGPCYVAFERRDSARSVPVLRPLLYREVELTATEEGCDITPRQGKWAFCPPVWGLLDQAQVVLPDDEQAFLGEMIDEAAQRAKDRDESLASAVLATLIDRLPDLREVLSRRLPAPAARRGSASPWVLFAPQASGAFKYNRHLMADYRRIAEQLAASAEQVGGLGILEGGWTHEVDRKEGIQPLVALNDRQRDVVERVIGGAPLTVVTGPPGCGKSQVVLSVLLNAWACGQSVLFVSSNNNAVDVVRERLDRLDSAVPIAVRAGSKERNNAVGLLRNISTRVGQRRGQLASDASAASEAQLQPLIERREALREMRDSRVPQKITEQSRSAMAAYAKERGLNDKIEKETGRLEHEWRRHGSGTRRLARTRQMVEESLDAARAWIDRKPDFEQQQRIDDEERRRLDQAIRDAERVRDDALDEAGVMDPRTVEELMRHGSPDDLATWHAGLDRILKYAASDLLTPPEWHVEFERWSSAREADQASRDLKTLGDRVSRHFDELSVRIESLGARAQAMTQARKALHRYGMDTPPAIAPDLIDSWKRGFAITLTVVPSRMDRLFPWRPLPGAKRKLRQIERMLLKSFPLATWRHVGPIEGPGGRDRVSEVLESITRWRQAKEEQRAAGEVSVQVSDVFTTLTERARRLGVPPNPAVQGAEYLSPKAWDDLAKEAHARSREADAAAGAWRRRADHENALDSVRQWLERWRILGSAVHDTLAEGSEAPLAHALRRLASDPGTPALRQLEEADGKCDVAGFLRAWRAARRHHSEATDLRRQREAIPSLTARVMAWWDQTPEALVTTFTDVSRDRWPEPQVLDERLVPLDELLKETKRFLDHDRPDWKKSAREERKRANEGLRKAAELVPMSKTEGRALRERCMKASASNASWPIDALRDEFRQFGIETLVDGIESIDRKLAQSALRIAEADWLQRLLDDDEACRAVGRLETSLARNNGILPPEQVMVFRHALRAAPVWITTAKSVQSVPTAPELFDVVLVDEASQCTLTDLLPALYRGRRWVVIGDSEQLPAIPTVRKTEEQALSQKYGLDPFLDRVGHSDLFTLCAAVLPRGRSDVLQLREHFRSHPQIIGFSNRHIYQQRLQLAPDTLDRSPLPVASGVFPVPVAGRAERGDRGSSWINRSEAERVVEEVERLTTREGLNGGTIGIVTPFGEQKKLIQMLLVEAQISNDLKVDSAHGFQGDERDIMVFSPVVAQGMTPGAQRWVDTPPNLINVALTRARHALFVVADLDFLRRQPLPSLLHRLAAYCQDVATLRATSDAELRLYSWMILQGWTPTVHPRIGDLEVDFTLSPPHPKGAAPLAIEVDGEAYHREDSATDKARDAFLAARDFQVLRVSAREVFETPLTVIAEIERRMKGG